MIRSVDINSNDGQVSEESEEGATPDGSTQSETLLVGRTSRLGGSEATQAQARMRCDDSKAIPWENRLCVSIARSHVGLRICLGQQWCWSGGQALHGRCSNP